jgi:hypothetical protein
MVSQKTPGFDQAVASDNGGVPAWATEGADATLLAGATYSGMPAVRPRWVMRENMPLVPAARNDGGVYRLVPM